MSLISATKWLKRKSISLIDFLNKKTIFVNFFLILLIFLLPIFSVKGESISEIGTGFHLFANLTNNGDTKDIIIKGQMIYWLFILIPIFGTLFYYNLSNPIMKNFASLMCLVINFALIIIIPFNIQNYIFDTYTSINLSIKAMWGYYVLLAFYFLAIIIKIYSTLKEYRYEQIQEIH